MIEDQEVEVDGQRYHWQYDPDAGPQLCWNWMDERQMQPPLVKVSALNEKFFDHMAPRLAQHLSAEDQQRFRDILKFMGASKPRVNRIFGAAHEADTSKAEQTAKRQAAGAGSSNSSPFSNRTIRDWYFSNWTLPAWFPQPVSLLGSGPFDASDFQEFLRQRAISVRELDDQTTVLLLGRDGWKKMDIDPLIEAREGNLLRVYSQEMYLTHMASGRDPFFEPLSLLDEFKDGHPGLEFVASGWSGWVTPATAGSGGSSYFVPRVEQSPLNILGYKVGANGLEVSSRRSILRKAFIDELPYVQGPEYMSEWGEKDTASRLKRLADHLASLICNNCGRTSFRHAVDEWLADLEWLKDEFYRGHFIFQWPDMFVASR